MENHDRMTSNFRGGSKRKIKKVNLCECHVLTFTSVPICSTLITITSIGKHFKVFNSKGKMSVRKCPGWRRNYPGHFSSS